MSRPRWLRIGLFVSLHDVIMAAASFVIALWLRVGDLSGYAWDYLPENVALFTVVSAVVFRGMRLYRGVWRYASLNDLLAILQAVTVSELVFLLLTFILARLEGMPRSQLPINWLVLIALLAGPRLAYRLFRDGQFDLRGRPEVLPSIPVLMIGMGDAAEVFVRTLAQRPGSPYRVVGIVEETAGRVGYQIHGVEVLGTTEALASVVEQLSARDARPQRLVISPDLPGHRVREVLDVGERLDLTVARLPSLTELKASHFEIRPVAIEDLLNRPEAKLDRDGMRRLIAGRRVLVTGAGGSIGSELVRQICDFGPALLVLLDNGEYNLYAIDHEVGERWPNVPRRTALADVRDRDGILRTFRQHRPELVFHAAALKHVPMVEAHPSEGARTNVGGTRHVADAAAATDVTAMVMISTDKAVNPTNVMGATKRTAEAYCQALDLVQSARGSSLRFITVRFGNVLGSTGSVVPLFRQQLARGGPLTVTHPEIERYFMTIREAVSLVLQAAVLRIGHDGQAGEGGSGSLFVLDMGEPVKIVDLARQMIRLAGLRPGVDVQVAFTGLRPGETLTEELFHHLEALVPTRFAGINVASPRVADWSELTVILDQLQAAAERGDDDGVIAHLRALHPEFAAYADAARAQAVP